MNVAFTICSNNYLAQASLLAQSFLKHNPGFSFYIGLADKYSDQVDYQKFLPAVILPVEEIGLENLDELHTRFRIIEFNTAIKPSYFKYFFNNTAVENIFYIDPDIYFYYNLNALLDVLKNYDIIVTPHIVTPIPLDDMEPGENMFLNYGIYNLGFLGLKRNGSDVMKFLNWWEERTHKFGYINAATGFFTDQLWINLAPIFFEKVGIVKELEYNMAPWNLHERQVTKVDHNGRPVLNNGNTLVFYHFSGVKLNADNDIKAYYDRYNLDNLPELKHLYKAYTEELIAADYYHLKSIVPALGKPEKKPKPTGKDAKRSSFQAKLFRYGKKAVKRIINGS